MISSDNFKFSCFNKSIVSGVMPERVQVSVSNPVASQFFNIDVELYFNQILIDEISQCIEKKIFASIFNHGKKRYLDFRGKSHNPSKFDNLYLIPTLDKNSKFVSGSRIASELQDSSHFTPNSISNLNGKTIYPIGKFDYIDVYVNPFETWKSNHIISFKSINVDISNIQHFNDTFRPGSVTGYTSITCDLKFEVFYPEVIFILEDDYMYGYNEYISEQRDRKIDYIVNEDGRFKTGQDNQIGIYTEFELGSRYHHYI